MPFMKKRVTSIACTTIAALALGAGCDSHVKTMILTQPTEEANLKLLETNPMGDIGDVTVFEAPIKRDGKPYGSLMGTMTKVGALGQGTHPNREERMLTAVFDLPNGQISILGVSFYKKKATYLPSKEPMTRAIVGGTGSYVGIDGEVTTTHNPDGSYTHIIKIQ